MKNNFYFDASIRKTDYVWKSCKHYLYNFYNNYQYKQMTRAKGRSPDPKQMQHHAWTSHQYISLYHRLTFIDHNLNRDVN